MTGKEKCQFLRKIRAEIAEEYQIILHQEPCDNPDEDCLGICPVCEWELMYLEREIAQKEREGYVSDHKRSKEIMEYHRELVLSDNNLFGPEDLILDMPDEAEYLTGYMVMVDPDEDE